MPIISHKIEEIDAGCPRGTRVEIECDCCGTHFQRKAKLLHADRKRGRDGTRYFCTKVCRDKGNVVHQTEEITCAWCGKTFTRKKDPRTKRTFCSHSCSAKMNNATRVKIPKPLKTPKPLKERPLKTPRLIAPKLTLKCEGCGTEVVRTETQLKKTKHGKPYCSKGCRMRHYNANILTRTSNQRSQAEDILADMIHADFPALEISANNRSFLPSRLEIDILIPSAKLAIELNGPVHYMPIYGEDQLRKVQSKDAQKHLEIHDAGISLMVLDTSKLNSKKRQLEFLTKHYQEDIKPLLSGSRELESNQP